MTKKNPLDNLLVYQGGAIKTLGDGKVGGHLVMFGDVKTTDLYGEFFTAETDFDLERSDKTSVYYDHGLDGILKRRKLGQGMLSLDDDVGIWLEAQLEMRDEYEEAIYEMVNDGKLGWSSGTAYNLMSREIAADGKTYWISKWPLGLDASLTPAPAEPRIQAVPLRSIDPRSFADYQKALEDAEKASALDPRNWGTEEWTEVTEIYQEVLNE